MCGKLIEEMYGTRDAASNWEQAYMNFMSKCGFSIGKVTPCLFCHQARQLIVEVHGDDFTNTGGEEVLDWFKSKLDESFQFKHQARLGPDKHDDENVNILNRIMTWDAGFGIQYEADQRHGEILVESMGLHTAKPVSTPGIKDSDG